MLKVEYIGHAGWAITTPHLKLLCDPWLNTDGTFYNSWHQFPHNSHLDSATILKDIDILYISHGHLDHYDEETLLKINKNTQILIARYDDVQLKGNLQNLGFKNIRELNEGEIFQFEGCDLQIIKTEDHLDKDSALYFTDGTHHILNLNDCHPEKDQLDCLPSPDLLLFQASSALWYPCVYDYSEEQKKNLCRTKRLNVLERALNYARWTNAKHCIPNAGPVLFIDDKLDFWNNTRRHDYNPFPLNDDAAYFLQENGFSADFLVPEDYISLDKGERTTVKNEALSSAIYGDVDSHIRQRVAFLKENQQSNVPEADAPLAWKLFETQLRKIHAASCIYRFKLKYPFAVCIDGIKKTIDLKKDIDSFISDDENAPHGYKFEFKSEILIDLLSNKYIDFDDYFLSLNFKAFRDPDVFDDLLFALFRNFDIPRLLSSERLYALNQHDPDETFCRSDNGVEYEIQKYCPHLSADLEICGHFDDKGNFVCPVHNFKFEKENGECTTNGNYHLQIKKL